tara:strand:+ start:16307 stop:16927 length:621 start_codon:yes stop_codon:yes gene_type:complete
MTSEHLKLFGFTVFLFIVLQPNLFLKIPAKYDILFILFHSLIFALIYIIVDDNMFIISENFTSQEKDFLEKKCKEIEHAFEKYSNADITNMSEDDIKSITQNVIKDLNDDQIKRLRKYAESNLSKNNKNTYTKEHKAYDTEMQDKLNYIGDHASVDHIKLFDSLSRTEQNALEKILNSMNIDEIDKYLKLDVENLQKSIQDVLKST